MPLRAMKDLLEMIDHRYQTEDPLDYHSVIAFILLTNGPFGVNPACLAKARVSQDLSLVSPQIAHISKVLIVNSGTVPAPINHLAFWGYQPAHFHAHNPTFIGQTFLPDLVSTPPLSDGMDEFHPITINNAFSLWLDQKMVSKRLIVGQQALQPGAFGQPRKQLAPIARKPTIESPKVHSFEAEKQADGNDFASMQLSVFAFLDVAEFIVYDTKEPSDNFFGSHRFVLLLAFWFGK
jgi:hypothetical protein